MSQDIERSSPPFGDAFESVFHRFEQLIEVLSSIRDDNDEAREWLRMAEPVCRDAGSLLLQMTRSRRIPQLGFWQQDSLDFKLQFDGGEVDHYRLTPTQYWILFTIEMYTQGEFRFHWDGLPSEVENKDYPTSYDLEMWKQWEESLSDAEHPENSLVPTHVDPREFCTVSIRCAQILRVWAMASDVLGYRSIDIQERLVICDATVARAADACGIFRPAQGERDYRYSLPDTRRIVEYRKDKTTRRGEREACELFLREIDHRLSSQTDKTTDKKTDKKPTNQQETHK